jgi:hypothetical protein
MHYISSKGARNGNYAASGSFAASTSGYAFAQLLVCRLMQVIFFSLLLYFSLSFNLFFLGYTVIVIIIIRPILIIILIVTIFNC